MRLNPEIKTAPQADHRTVPGKPSTESSLAIPSLAFPDDRRVLRVGEVAQRLCVTETHIHDLIAEGKLLACDTAGRVEFMRVPVLAIDAIADHFKAPRELVPELINAAKPTRNLKRAFWRIPVKEGFEAFIGENHSLAKW